MKRIRQRRAWLLLSLLLLTGCSSPQNAAAPAPPVSEPRTKLALVQEAVYTFSDGVTADLWAGDGYDALYCLPDGTKLLHVDGPTGPQETTAFKNLTAKAQEKISAFCTEQGLLFDPYEELEIAYQMYRSWQDEDHPFSYHDVRQFTEAPGGVAGLVCFSITVSRPIYGDCYDGHSYWDELHPYLFNKRTGGEVPLFDLFRVSEEKAWGRLRSSVVSGDPARQEEMAEALRPEYLTFNARCISVAYPPGSLKDFPDSTYDTYIPYDEIKDILKFQYVLAMGQAN